MFWRGDLLTIALEPEMDRVARRTRHIDAAHPQGSRPARQTR